MELPVFILLTGLLYAFVFGGLALLRREKLSVQFALEAITITILASGLAAFMGVSIHPLLFLLLLYLVTMRVRLLVDLGNFFAQRGKFERAHRIYNLALRLLPDRSGNLIVLLNLGIANLQSGAIDEAIQSFKGILEKVDQGHLGVKYEAATHYNLGVAYRRKSLEAQAVVEFNATIDTWPASEYARRAQIALSKGHHKD